MHILLHSLIFISLLAPQKLDGRASIQGHAHLYRHAHYVDLSWTASTSPDVTYNIYRTTIQGGPYTKIESGIGTITATDYDVISGVTYYYVATAFDGSLESVYSNEAVAVVP